MQLELELQSNRRVSLLIAASARGAWDGAIAAWCARVARENWKTQRPAAIVVPTRGQAQALKACLLEHGQSALGIHFVTPPHLRILLAGDIEISSPQREHFRLLLALAAEEQLADSSLAEAERLAAISVRRTPDHLLRLLEQLSAAGADFNQVDLPAFRSVVRKFRAQLASAGLDLAPEADRKLLGHARSSARALEELLVSGFHGAHWPLWNLLHAATESADAATVFLQYPRAEAADLDAAWIGTWEEKFGEAKPIESETDTPAPERETIFLAGMDTREQAEAITAAAEKFLADESCTRLGIIVPAAGALARLVAAACHRRGLPHYDAMGQMVPGIFESADFWSWLELQRTPRLNVLLRFLTHLPNEHAFFNEISRRKIADALTRAHGELALDELPLLIAFARTHNEHGELVAAALRSILFLPERATFAEFSRVTADAFQQLDWNESEREIQSRTGWATDISSTFSRTLYLQWLEEIALSFTLTRDLLGQHPYARVQILTPAQAEDQSWSHLILAGLNENAWPASARGDFLPAAQIDSLNQAVQKINRAATRRGRQGEGHVAVREGATLFLGTAQQRQLALAQFNSLVESTRCGLALTASVVQEATPERVSNPSEFFSRIYHQVHGRSVSQTTLRGLRDATRAWLQEAAAPSQNESENAARGIRQTRLAYSARRDPEAVSGEYDFALRTRPKETKPMSVSAIEALLKSPALVWLERYLGVAGEEDSTYAWNATVGKWTHQWLADAIGRSESFVPFPSANEIAQRLLTAAERKRAEVAQLCRETGKIVPDWWESGWENALCLAQTLGRILATAEGWNWAVPEWRLEAQAIPVGDDRHLLLRGFADLLLVQSHIKPTSLRVPALWIVDYKTGNKKSLSVKNAKTPEMAARRVLRQVLKRDALQLGLYALAAEQFGAENVQVSLLSPLTPRAEPQLQRAEFSVCEPAFRELARMQATGIFGMHGTPRDRFSFTRDYPLATLAIDREITEERWEKTHPDLPIDEEAY